ncbi:MAG: hypothetical protein KatS3mg103_1386 [Phycisphaerales bacterium]|nr:MAG: hypothetical protein KatS3mg103_1386 [Phycisphaerales bacterium]
MTRSSLAAAVPTLRLMLVVLLLVLLPTAVALPGCNEQASPQASVESAQGVVDLAEGRSLYLTHCMMCHQPQGEGVPGMQPPLVGSQAVLGDPRALIELTLRGVGDHRGALPASGRYRQQMQGFAHLSDHEIAAVLTYIRRSWGNNASAVGEERVWEIRQGL